MGLVSSTDLKQMKPDLLAKSFKNLFSGSDLAFELPAASLRPAISAERESGAEVTTLKGEVTEWL